jgi:hypothetical protein
MYVGVPANYIEPLPRSAYKDINIINIDKKMILTLNLARPKSQTFILKY